MAYDEHDLLVLSGITEWRENARRMQSDALLLAMAVNEYFLTGLKDDAGLAKLAGRLSATVQLFTYQTLPEEAAAAATADGYNERMAELHGK